ncbi:MAG: protein translocase subunit SecDF [Bacteroidales bacterium]|jgi:SecD/SecF fusion protein|nr:protein translocase subunit SecDF [Bacteroidales bacterium]
MQNRGAIKFFAIAFALVCLYQLSFTFVTTMAERNAEEYAVNQTAQNLADELAGNDEVLRHYYLDSISKSRENYYLDSISNVVIYDILIDEYTYKEAKERELNLGLDLKGGMNVVLDVSVGDIIYALSGKSDDPVFKEALALTYQKKKNSNKDFVTLFGESFEEVDPNAQLASIFLFEFRDKGITTNSTNEEVLTVIRSEAEGAIDRSFQILRTRIDRFGVAQPNIQKLATSGRILIELPGIKDPDRVRKLLQGTAKLEFWETYKFSEVFQYFDEANAQLRDEEIVEDDIEENPESIEKTAEETAAEGQEAAEETAGDDLIDAVNDTTSDKLLEQLESDTTATDDMNFQQYAKRFPLYAYLNPSYVQNENGQTFPAQSARMGIAAIKDTARVNHMLRLTKDVFPRDMKLVWTVKPNPASPDVLELVALKTTQGEAALGGDVIVDARQDYDQNGGVAVDMQMNAQGAKIWKRITGENVGRQIAIVLDNYVYSYPNVNDEIPTGRSSISGGSMTLEEAQDLANILKAGKLPAPAKIVEEAVVGPSLGREAVSAGMNSFILAFIMVLAYMIVYYNRSGLVANVALVANIFFLFGVLASLGAVLTLPGMAGIVLTLGMAVDANVIIFERIKEEVRAGKGARLAITDGYKNAYSAIIDGNVTTLLTGIVLYIFGTGPVQGFATTLIIGILSSLFTAIFISRLIFTWMLNKNMKVSFSNKYTANFLANSNYNFIGVRKRAYIISAVLIILSVGSLAIKGLNLGIDFTGGRTYVVRFDKNVDVEQIRKDLTVEFEGMIPDIKTFGSNSQIKLTTKFMIDNDSTYVDALIQKKLYNSLSAYYTTALDYKEFSTDTEGENKLLGILSSQKIGPTIAYDIRTRAIYAVVFALLIIFVYIAIRFKKWQYGLAGVIALFHDSIITMGMFSIFYGLLPFSMEVDQAFIAAILTIIGYSINDTVIIFDRIREYTHLFPRHSLKRNINEGLNSTLARTINTSGTTLVVLLIIFLFGGETIRGFVFALLIGILVGTYSSLFTASPVAYDLLGGDKQEKQILEKEAKSASRKKKN